MAAIQGTVLKVIPLQGKWKKRYKKIGVRPSKVGVEKEGG
jgi:hypothetical protein